jgi:GTP cyclohydrolase III
MEGTQVTATSTATTNLRQLTTSLKTVREAVLDAMQSQFYKIYHPMYGKAVIGGCSLPTKEKYDEVVASLLLGKSLSMLVMRILGQ